MSKLYITCGCSGCGKTTYGEKLKLKMPDLVIVCPDDIRKELTGDISDQSHNDRVWFLAYKLIVDSLKVGKDVFVSATTLSSKGLKEILRRVEKFNPDITLLAFEDSRDWELCFSRVKNDIDNGIDRSNSLVNIIENDKEIPLIKKMSDRYINMVDKVLPENYPNLKVQYI